MKKLFLTIVFAAYLFLAIFAISLFFIDNAYAAIDLSSASSGKTASGLTLSYSHTQSATTTNNILLVGIALQNNTNDVTGVSYGGQALTLATSSFAQTTTRDDIWYLVNPPTGVNNVVVTTTGSNITIQSGSVSLSGANQSAPEANATISSGVNNVASIDYSITTVSDNAWIVSEISVADNETSCSVSASTTIRSSWCSNSNGTSFMTAGGPYSPASSKGFTASWSPTNAKVAVTSISIAQFVSSTPVSAGITPQIIWWN